MSFSQSHCPECNSENFKRHTGYTLKNGEARQIYYCWDCDSYFSETKNTPLAGLKTPISRMALILEAINDGMGLNAACRTFHVGKNSLKRWVSRLGDLKETLLLYALCHQFIQQLVEGDELYTKVGQNKPAIASEGWTVVLMDRASRFIWELKCGPRETDLFQQAMETLAQVIEQTDDLTLVTDGERRYGNLLFDICQETLRTGQVGRPKKH
jgi:transposase-like protein